MILNNKYEELKKRYDEDQMNIRNQMGQRAKNLETVTAY